MPGLYSPTPAQLSSKCPLCNGVWEPFGFLLELSTVFLPAAVLKTTFIGHRCQTASCTGLLRCDGTEQGLMRKTASLAFSLELFYEWSDWMGDGGIPWHTFWRHVLQRYYWCAQTSAPGSP